jgi:hypothetical protein
MSVDRMCYTTLTFTSDVKYVNEESIYGWSIDEVKYIVSALHGLVEGRSVDGVKYAILTVC